EGLMAQRTRWEHGHVSVMARAPALLARAIAERKPALAAMALDVGVPPLAFLVLSLGAALMIAAAFFAATGAIAPLLVAVTALSLFGIGIGLAWWRFGRSIVSWQELFTVPYYVVAKIPLYIRALTKRQTEWVRTRRDGSAK
ncbi:MAG TPA: glycosyl transferase, partial [Albitalea sp.]|nr:glycosyl transferase [Albitalea sp.]